VPRSWQLSRPGDPLELTAPKGLRLGSPGPDAGYGMKLAKRVAERLEPVAPDAGVSVDDALAGCFACGSHRAAAFGRAPVIHDMEWAFTLWGWLGGAPDDLITFRNRRFRGVSHHYWEQREIVDAVRPQSLRLSAAEVASRLGSWEELLVADEPD
jgi:hypothetical protein